MRWPRVAPVGGGKIDAERARRGPKIELAVRDSGIGFRPGRSARAVPRSSRGSTPAAASSYYGTGLGLFIVAG